MYPKHIAWRQKDTEEEPLKIFQLLAMYISEVESKNSMPLSGCLRHYLWNCDLMNTILSIHSSEILVSPYELEPQEAL